MCGASPNYIVMQRKKSDKAGERNGNGFLNEEGTEKKREVARVESIGQEKERLYERRTAWAITVPTMPTEGEAKPLEKELLPISGGGRGKLNRPQNNKR